MFRAATALDPTISIARSHVPTLAYLAITIHMQAAEAIFYQLQDLSSRR
jgi:hypothetical protein